MNRREATEAFIHGFAFSRSATHPVEVVRIADLVVLRDVERRSGDYRVEEVIAVDLESSKLLEQLRHYRPRKNNGWCVCPMQASGTETDAMKQEMKLAGFRARYTSPLFVRRPTDGSASNSPFPVRRVFDSSDLERLRKASRTRVALPQDLEGDDPNVRLYAAFDGDRPISWVRSVKCPGQCAWVQDMYTVEAFRRQGLATALMQTMLRGDFEQKVKWSVLLASPAGAYLYRSLGYTEIGALQIFSPGFRYSGHSAA